ncbi:hypothetical protein [Bowmanella yangjiangensis]|uniref:Uncharacterized protein n=1 Tax=Bowmanella yangjiangensis TaxID=2811230 RepID=A0ABS3CRP2_9ALTE|nr:hypothetical protein [Bowmanella yangjiangensis]MBN7819786.1 hypothetical protein [Bowmanella yangjiangensis]
MASEFAARITSDFLPFAFQASYSCSISFLMKLSQIPGNTIPDASSTQFAPGKLPAF